jgi:hypothetical protein
MLQRFGMNGLLAGTNGHTGISFCHVYQAAYHFNEIIAHSILAAKMSQ